MSYIVVTIMLIQWTFLCVCGIIKPFKPVGVYIIMYKNIKTYEIRYTDVDFKDELKLSSLLSILEESACLSADELGFGYNDIAPRGIGFILANWYIEIYRPMTLRDRLTVHTWPMKPKNTIFFREFEVYCDGIKVCSATTRWCMVDLKTFGVLPTSAFFEGDTREYNDFRAIEFNSWRIPPVKAGVKKYEKVVSSSDYDHYFHVNNTKYADFCLDAFSVDELEGKSLGTVQITYVKQCKYGEKLEFYRSDEGDISYVEGRVNGEPRVRLKVEFIAE